VIILKRELNGDVTSGTSDTEMLTKNQDSVNGKESKDKESINKSQDFVMSNNKLPS